MDELKTEKKVHDLHPSLANLTGAINNAKEKIEERLKSTEEQKFKIVAENITLFEDKSLSKQTETIVLEKNAVVSGKYLYDDDKHVFFLGNPYNVYCKAIDVEPENLKHTHSNEVVVVESNDENIVQTTNENEKIDDDGDEQTVPEHEVRTTTLIQENDGNVEKEAKDDDFVQVDLNGNDNDQKDEDEAESAGLEAQITLTEYDTLLVEKKETDTETGVMQRSITDTIPAQQLQIYNHPISASADAPEVDTPTMNEYPAKDITAMEDLRPSFIATLPNKEVVNDSKNEDDDHPINEQAMSNENNETHIVTTDKSENKPKSVCCICL